MALIAEIPRVLRALELARLDEANRIAEAVQVDRVVGVLGEAEVGKSETIRQALGPSVPNLSVIQLDLDGVAGEAHAAFLLTKQIALALLGAPGLSTLKVGMLVPAKIEATRVELAELLGVDGLDEALRDWPSGRYPLTRALDAVEGLCERRPAILWIDHLEAPTLTPRHPFNVDRFLWGVRELAQRIPNLSVVLSARDAIGSRILSPEAAFHQQGRWLSIDYPPPDAWQKIAAGLGVSAPIVAELESLTEGHPATMLLCLLSLMEGGRGDAHETVRSLVAGDAGLAARALQHARSLHRLGGQVMTQVANGEAPYADAQRGASPPQEIRKVLERLRLAGLLRHAKGWSVVNPLVGMALSGRVAQVTAPDWELESQLGPERD